MDDLNNPVYEIHNIRGRLIALCADGSVWLFDIPDRNETRQDREKAIREGKWIRLPNIPKE